MARSSVSQMYSPSREGIQTIHIHPVFGQRGHWGSTVKQTPFVVENISTVEQTREQLLINLDLPLCISVNHSDRKCHFWLQVSRFIGF